MRKIFLLARSNLRKSKGQTTALIVLILFAALMLNLWLMLSMDYKQNFDRYHDKLNAEHVTLAIDGDNSKIQEFLIQTLKADNRTSEFSLDSSMHMVGLFLYNEGEVNSELIILEKQTALSRSVGKIEIVEEDSQFTSGIYMPILYKSDDIAIGKTVQISIGSNKVSYTVCGFFNSIMAGSHNCAMCELILTKDKYDELQRAGYVPKSTLCSIRLKDKAESENYEAMLKNSLSSQYPSARTVSNSYALVSQSRYISQMVCSGIVSAMAFLVLLIALVVISSNSYWLYKSSTCLFSFVSIFRSFTNCFYCWYRNFILSVSFCKYNDDFTDRYTIYCSLFTSTTFYYAEHFRRNDCSCRMAIFSQN